MPLFLLLLAVFLFPIGVYCGVLGMINRRLRPLLVNGLWDFVGVLLASSGFLLVVGPAVISGQYRRNLFEFSFSRPTSPRQTCRHLAAGRLVAVLPVAPRRRRFLLWLRSRSTVIYNVEVDEFESRFPGNARPDEFDALRVGNRYALSVASPTAATTDNTAISVEPLTARPPSAALLALNEQAIVEVDSFPALYHVTLHWRVFNPPLRLEVERDLERALAKLETPENATATWFLSISTSVFLLIFLALGAIIFGSLLPRR